MSEPGRPVNTSAVTVALMLSTLMNTLDSTIANVALPHIQGSLSAAADEVVWVLTSYIVAAAMTTPISGWLANRFGIKRVFLTAVGGFTVASVLCGLATSLPELVLFRFVQGALGAFTLPLGQTVLFNIYPPSRHAQAMSIWAMGAIAGPLLGPVVGGYITDAFSWRWCFLINLPIGALAFAGVWSFMPTESPSERRRLDFLGFISLIIAVGALQLMLDRGPGQDWFNSREIWIGALIAAIGFWVFLAHTVTTNNPFIAPAIFRDENMVGGGVLVFVVMAVIFGSLALLPQLTQGLMGYPVLLSGVANTPRGVGMLLTMWASPRLLGWFGARPVVMVGILATGAALWEMAHFDLSMGLDPLLFASFWQGFGQGLMFVPISTLAFSTLSPENRAEAAAVFNLLRSIGSSIGISTLQALAVFNTQRVHASMAALVQATDPMFRWAIPHGYSPETVGGASALNAEITRQATMVAYVDDFRLMFLLTLLCVPLVMLLRGAPGAKVDPSEVTAE
jgi:DHA2 family multidrug resistance protein